MPRETSSQCDPVDTRIRTNVEKRGARRESALDTLLVAFNPIRGSGIGELAATFDLILGKTLEELEDGKLGGGVAISQIQRPKG